MKTITSGTSTERMVRACFLAAMVSGYAGWSLWDGYVGYPRANVAAVLRDRFGAEPDPRPLIQPDLTRGAVEELRSLRTPGDVKARLGDAGASADDRVVYFGTGGFIEFNTSGNRIESVEWHNGPLHSPTDLAIQKIAGFVLLPIGLGLVIHVIRVAATRAVLTADHLTIRGHGSIPRSAITRIDPAEPGATDRYDVHYTREGRDVVLRLDSYVIRQTPAIVSAIRDTR